MKVKIQKILIRWVRVGYIIRYLLGIVREERERPF